MARRQALWGLTASQFTWNSSVNRPHHSSGEKLRFRIEKLLLLAADIVDFVGPAAEPWLERLELEYRAAMRPSAHDRVAALLKEGRGHE